VKVREEDGDNYVMGSFMIYSFHWKLLIY